MYLVFTIFPDVIFSKGSYVSVPTVIAARIFGIPIIIHDSDAIPGRANLMASKFAYRIGISYPYALEFFDKKVQEKVALVGNPVRKEILHPTQEGAFEYLGFSHEIPTILILGGSQGAQAINNVIIDSLPELVSRYQVIHQTGKDHEKEITGMANIILENDPFKNRYKAFGYMNDLALRMSAGAAQLVISRAGSGTIFETAAWGMPSIVIPISEKVARDQRKNAYAYAKVGAAVVLEEHNLTPHVLVAEIDRIMDNPEARQAMSEAAGTIYRPDAATKIAEELLGIGIKHEED